MELILIDGESRTTVPALWRGPLPAHDRWIPEDSDFDGPAVVVGTTCFKIQGGGPTCAAVNLEIGDERGVGIVFLIDEEYAVLPFDEGRSVWTSEDAEIDSRDRRRPFADLVGDGRWFVSSGGRWVPAADYAASHPDWRRAWETIYEPIEYDDDLDVDDEI